MTTASARRIRRLGPLTALALAATLSGCSEPDTSPIPNDLPTASAGAPASGFSPTVGRWTGFKGKCPVLTSAAAGTLGTTGEGRPTPDYREAQPLQADCAWGADDGKGTAVTARVTIYPVDQAAEAAWRVLDAGNAPEVPGLGDAAFSVLEPQRRAVAVRVRSANAVAVVLVVVPESDRDALTARLRQVEPAAREIARDVVEDLT